MLARMAPPHDDERRRTNAAIALLLIGLALLGFGAYLGMTEAFSPPGIPHRVDYSFAVMLVAGLGCVAAAAWVAWGAWGLLVLATAAAGALGLLALSGSGHSQKRVPPPVDAANLPAGPGDLYAILATSCGRIVIRLLEDEAPRTVALFTGLASGNQPWTDMQIRSPSHDRYFDGTSLREWGSTGEHYAIQGGRLDAPGYCLDHEQGRRSFDRPGLVAWIRDEPIDNCGTFVITEAAAHELDGKDTLFGES